MNFCTLNAVLKVHYFLPPALPKMAIWLNPRNIFRFLSFCVRSMRGEKTQKRIIPESLFFFHCFSTLAFDIYDPAHMFRLTTRLSASSAQAVQCVRELAMANNAGLNATIGSANLTKMRGVTGILAQSAPYSSVPRQMTQQMTLKEVGIMGNVKNRTVHRKHYWRLTIPWIMD